MCNVGLRKPPPNGLNQLEVALLLCALPAVEPTRTAQAFQVTQAGASMGLVRFRATCRRRPAMTRRRSSNRQLAEVGFTGRQTGGGGGDCHPNCIITPQDRRFLASSSPSLATRRQYSTRAMPSDLYVSTLQLYKQRLGSHPPHLDPRIYPAPLVVTASLLAVIP